MSSKTTKGLMLRSIEGVLMQIAQFALQIVLARILMPEDFGVVAILTTFVNLANTFVNSGLSQALLQKKEVGKADICTVFYIELGISLLMYGIIFGTAPLIARFYENEMLVPYLRTFALSVVFGGISSIQLTMSRFDLNFRPGLIASVCGVTVQATVGILLALNGFGTWSLVIAQVLYYAVRSVALIVQVRWIPSFIFSFASFKRLFSYSWKLFVGWMIGTLYHDVFSWIIGKKYDSATLGYYSKGNSIPSIVNRVVTQVTTSVMFPSLSKNQDDLSKIKEQTRLMISVSAALVLPVMAGIAGCADSIVRLLLTNKWLLAVPVVQLMCIPLALNVIGNANIQAFNAIGRSDLFMRLEMVKRGITIVLVLITMNIDYYLMLASIGVGGMVAIIINAIYNKKLLKYKYSEYTMDILPYVLVSVILFILTNAVNLLPLSVLGRFIAQLGVCAIIYLGMIVIGALPGFKSIKKILLNTIRNRKN